MVEQALPVADADFSIKRPPSGPSRGHYVCLAATLLIAFALRAAAIIWGQSYAYNSQADCLEAYAVAVDFELGDSRARYLGQPNITTGSKLAGPAWTLFCVLGLKLGGSIEGVSWLLATTNVVAILLIYLLARQTIGPNAGLFAALLLATSLQGIRFSIGPYNPGMMPFLSTLLFLALWRVVSRDASRAIFWVPFLLLLTLQFHLSVLVLIPTAALAIAVSGRRVTWSWLLLGVVAGLALYLPYIAGELNHDWENTRAIFSPRKTELPSDPLRGFTAPISFLAYYWWPRWIYTDSEFQSLFDQVMGGTQWAKAAYVLSLLFALMLIGQVFHLGWKAGRGIWKSPRTVFARNPGLVFLIVLFLAPLAVGLVFQESFRPRYSLIQIPPLFTLAGAASAALLANSRLRAATALLGAAVVAINIYFVVSMYRFQGQHIESAPRFVASFPHLERVYQELRIHAGDGRPIAVDDRHFFIPSQSDENIWFIDAMLIRPYVELRERERTRGVASSRSRAQVYELYQSWQSESDGREAAYAGNGIVLTPTDSD